MKEFLIRMKPELFDRIKLYAKQYDWSIRYTIIRLVEIGYIESMKMDNSFYNKED